MGEDIRIFLSEQFANHSIEFVGRQRFKRKMERS